MEMKFTVGEMAKLNGVSKQTLIYYDRMGVFCPRQVDPQNGYRYYTSDQLEELDSVLILRELGFSLEEIKGHMSNRTGKRTLQLLREQQTSVREKLNQLALIERRMERKIKSLEDFFAREDKEITFVQRKKEYLAVQSIPPKPEGILGVDMALKKLLRRAGDCAYVHDYQIGDMISPENLENHRFLCFSHAFLPLEKPCPPADLWIKPAGTYARGYHIGSYATTGETYEALLFEISQKGYHPVGYAYEYCVLDCLTTRVAEEYITEIQIGVEKNLSPRP